MTEPERMFSTALRGMSFGAGLPGTAAVVTTTSKSGMRSSSAACCCACCSGVSSDRVAARRLLRSYTEIQERRTEALDLLLHGGPDVERRDHGAEPARRRDRLQARDAGTDDEHPNRRDRSRRSHEHREEPRHAIGRKHHCLVSGHGRLRGERVHGLRTRDARDRLHREGNDATLA